MALYIESKHPLHVLTETQFKQISNNNITVNNIIPFNINVSQKKIRQTFCKISRDGIGVNIVSHFKNLKHHNLICLSTVKHNFLSITMEIDSSLRNNNMVSLSGGDSSESSNMVLLFLATYNNKKQERTIDQSIYRYIP